MITTPGRPRITWVAEGAITDGPVFNVLYGARRTCYAIGYRATFTYSDGAWTTRSITIVGAVAKGDGTPGKATKDVLFFLSDKDTPDWVHTLFDEIRPTATI